MPGPSEYRSDPSEGIKRSEDLPKTKIRVQSRNYRRRPCPRCGHRSYRDGTDPRDGRGWFPTGDLGSMDPTTGHLTVSGRAGDVIVTGGEKVWPTDVEAVRLFLNDLSPETR